LFEVRMGSFCNRQLLGMAICCLFTVAEKVGLFTTIVHKRNKLLERISHLGINYEALWAQ